MPAWSLKAGGAAAAEWFNLRFQRARGLIPAADFDTIIGEDFAQTITSELVDVVGAASADPVDFYNGGVVAVAVGDAVITPSSARFQPTIPPSHVGDLTGKSWYAASLVRVIRPPDDELGATAVDALGLWADAANRIGLGIFNGSGGSTSNWVGYATVDSSTTTVLGPLLGSSESPVWHLFEAWFNVGTGALRFAIDGLNFADAIDVDDMPGVPAHWAMTIERSAVGNQAIPQYDKVCVVVASPRIGEAD
jgi:hypothetical protein